MVSRLKMVRMESSKYLYDQIRMNSLQMIEDNVSTFEIVHKEYGIKFMKARKVVEVVYPDEDVSR